MEITVPVPVPVPEPTQPSQTAPMRRRRRVIGLSIVAVVLLALLAGWLRLTLGPPPGYSTNVSIALRYVADDGRAYSCTYDYSTPNDIPMPSSVAQQMNEKDWSETGQLMYDWARAHPNDSARRELAADDPRADPAATWSAAMDKYVVFPPWSVETDTGSTYVLRSEARDGSNCEEGLG